MMDWTGCGSRQVLSILMHYSRHYSLGAENIKQSLPEHLVFGKGRTFNDAVCGNELPGFIRCGEFLD
jgi:hypothetical protein